MGYNKKEKKLAEKKVKNSHIKKKLFVMVSFFLGVFIIGGVFAYLIFFAKPNNELSNGKDTGINYSLAELANQTAAKGDYEGGQNTINQALNNTVKDTDKVVLYIEQSMLALNNKKYEDSYTYAQKAENIAKSKLTSRVIAQIAEAAGDKIKALEYYNMTISRYSEEEKNSEELSLAYFEDMQKIKELQND